MNPQTLQDTINAHLDTEYVLVESADNVHFYVTVVSAQFEHLSKIKQHKLVKELFSAQFADETIHAMSLKTYTPEKWSLKSVDAPVGTR